MTTPETGNALATALRDWHPPTVETVRRVGPWQSAAFAGGRFEQWSPIPRGCELSAARRSPT